MTTTTTPTTHKGLSLPCPCCGEVNADVNLNLSEPDNSDSLFECRECSAEFGRSDLEERMARWAAVLRWVADRPS
jgi:hypothetical protein